MFKAIATLAVIFMIAGCNNDDDKILNKITVAGNENQYDEYNDAYTPEGAYYYPSSLTGCTETIYYRTLQINFTPGSTLWIVMYSPTNETSIPTGTFTIVTAECEEGIIASFSLPVGKGSRGIGCSSGTVKISKEGEIYDLDVNLTIDPEDGGGTITGNFSGELNYADM